MLNWNLNRLYAIMYYFDMKQIIYPMGFCAKLFAYFPTYLIKF